MKPRRNTSMTNARIASCAMAIIVVAVVAMLLSSGYASAAGLKILRGYTKDSAGHPLENAAVVLEVRRPDNSLRFTDSYASDENGFYSFILDSVRGEWADGDTFKIIATYSGNQQTRSQLDDGKPVQWINVTFPFEIPQFGSLLGFGIAAGAVGLVAMVFVVKRKKN